MQIEKSMASAPRKTDLLCSIYEVTSYVLELISVKKEKSELEQYKDCQLLKISLKHFYMIVFASPSMCNKCNMAYQTCSMNVKFLI